MVQAVAPQLETLQLEVSVLPVEDEEQPVVLEAADAVETSVLGDLNDVVSAYLPLVKYVVGRMSGKISGLGIIDYDDLLSFGVQGLIETYYAYDPGRGTKFSTYAVPRIRGAILDALRAAHPLPRSAQRMAARIDQATSELYNDLGRTPSRDELAERLGFSKDQLLDALARSDIHVLSLEGMTEQSQNRDGERTLEVADDDPNLDPEELTERAMMRGKLYESLGSLPERERRIVYLYYSESMSLRAIGQVMGLSESRICQLHNRAIERLRGIMKTELSFV
jgi:RNA polymerase sigma factor for flagellar operon FliA